MAELLSGLKNVPTEVANVPVVPVNGVPPNQSSSKEAPRDQSKNCPKRSRLVTTGPVEVTNGYGTPSSTLPPTPPQPALHCINHHLAGAPRFQPFFPAALLNRESHASGWGVQEAACRGDAVEPPLPVRHEVQPVQKVRRLFGLSPRPSEEHVQGMWRQVYMPSQATGAGSLS